MPLQKNQILTLRIERLSSDGSGVAHSPDGETVFVPGAAPGDEADVRIVKDCKRYAFGILDHLRTPSPDRIPVDCAVAGPCGGCSLRHLDYTAELRAKQENVTDAFRRIGGLDVPVLDIRPSPEVDRYRNKVQFPVGLDKNGNPCIGFYAGRTHRIVPCPDCKLQPGVLNDIGNALCRFFAENGIQPYNEETGRGLVRHIFLRRGAHSGQIMVCLVCTRPNFPHADALCTRLREQFADIATILLNVNSKNTNVILGTETHTLYGPGYIEDTLCGVPVQLAYKETIRNKVKVEGKFIRQSGGRGQYGHVWLEMEPLEPGSGIQFESKIVGGVVPKEYIKPIEEGIREAAESGILAGYPVIDFKATLVDGSYHDVDSSEMAFKIAGSMAFKEGCKQAKSVILEPIMKVEVTVPEEYMGDVIGDINSRRGRMEGMESRSGNQIIRAFIPLSEMFGYATDLRSKTQGRGTYAMEPSHYEEVPKSVFEAIVASRKKAE